MVSTRRKLSRARFFCCLIKLNSFPLRSRRKLRRQKNTPSENPVTENPGTVHMGGGTRRFPGRDLAMHVYMSYLSRSVYMETILPGRFSSRPGKAGSRFAQPGSRLKRDSFFSSYKHSVPGRYYADFANCLR